MRDKNKQQILVLPKTGNYVKSNFNRRDCIHSLLRLITHSARPIFACTHRNRAAWPLSRDCVTSAFPLRREVFFMFLKFSQFLNWISDIFCTAPSKLPAAENSNCSLRYLFRRGQCTQRRMKILLPKDSNQFDFPTFESGIFAGNRASVRYTFLSRGLPWDFVDSLSWIRELTRGGKGIKLLGKWAFRSIPPPGMVGTCESV